MLGAAEAGPLDERQRAHVDLLRAETAFSERRGSDAPPLLLRAAKALEPLDPVLARDTYLEAWSAALFAGELASAGGLHEVSRQARDAPEPPGPPRPADLLLDALRGALHRRARRRGADAARERRRLPHRRGAGAGSAPLGMARDAAAVVDLGLRLVRDDRRARRSLARETGALAVLTVALNVLTQAVALSGEFGARRS